jgi:hypothetical protein
MVRENTGQDRKGNHTQLPSNPLVALWLPASPANYSVAVFGSPSLPCSSHSVARAYHRRIWETRDGMAGRGFLLLLCVTGNHIRRLSVYIPISVPLAQFSSPPRRELPASSPP